MTDTRLLKVIYIRYKCRKISLVLASRKIPFYPYSRDVYPPGLEPLDCVLLLYYYYYFWHYVINVKVNNTENGVQAIVDNIMYMKVHVIVDTVGHVANSTPKDAIGCHNCDVYLSQRSGQWRAKYCGRLPIRTMWRTIDVIFMLCRYNIIMLLSTKYNLTNLCSVCFQIGRHTWIVLSPFHKRRCIYNIGNLHSNV